MLFLSTVWANMGASEALVQIPLTNATADFGTARVATAPNAGTQAPNFQLRDVDGRPTSLLSLRGRNVLLYFVTDCQTCPLGSAPELDTRYAGQPNTRLVIIAPSKPAEMRAANQARLQGAPSSRCWR